MGKVVLPSDMTKGWTPDDIKALLALPGDRGVHATGRALLAIYARQTAAEKATSSTKEFNGVGFSAFDAELMTSMASFYRKAGFLTPKQMAYLRTCPGKQKTTRIGKYARQLADIANAKVEHKLLMEEVTA